MPATVWTDTPSTKGKSVKKITVEDAVRALKNRKTAHPARALADDLGVTSRAVATAMRNAVADGRVTIRFKKGIALYRFIRLTPRPITP